LPIEDRALLAPTAAVNKAIEEHGREGVVAVPAEELLKKA
jgi:hypothetical protein